MLVRTFFEAICVAITRLVDQCFRSRIGISSLSNSSSVLWLGLDHLSRLLDVAMDAGGGWDLSDLHKSRSQIALLHTL